jgi:predicted aldo/keto reductase-like oxidoreductase
MNLEKVLKGENTMLYRKLGENGPEVSILGFGCMRLPIENGSQRAADRFDPTKTIDEEKATELIHYAINQGVNYFDTAYPYHSGKSEPFLGKAVRGHREKLMIATKLPAWLVQGQEDFDKFLDEQLQRLDTGYLDFYLLHGLGRQTWSRMKELEAFRFLDRILADGRARRVGFSFHDDGRLFKEIVDAYDWALCQIQYNYLDRDYQAGREGLEYAASRGLGVVVMEPLRGGRLTDPIPGEVQALWDSAPEKRSAAEWALRWVWNHPHVSTALSGMNSMEQLQENIEIAGQAGPNSLSPADLDLIDRVTGTYKEMLKIDCTACAYCMPCPQGVNIPQNLRLYNDLFMFNDPENNSFFYNRMLSPEQRAANCTECGECEERCPQHLSIREELKKVHEALGR